MPAWKEALRWLAIALAILGGWVALFVSPSNQLAIWISAVVVVAVFTPVAVVLDNQRRAHGSASGGEKGEKQKPTNGSAG
jgi:hypothetical protein